ncbi:MAG: potassium transporter Kup [Actinomycetota bacterium]|nr:potassium transporter Kup [Actinomycetota bacterium]
MNPDPHTGSGHGARGAVVPLALGALGIVYGDIGTSPLYALRETFTGHGHELAVTQGNVLGVLSLTFWALLAIISVKYLAFVMRAEKDGEGGVLALTSLVSPSRGRARGKRHVLVLVGLFGTALLYGDGAITPAISVLAAVEGTTVAAPGVERFVVPLAVVILVALFAFQSRGTSTVGRVFGPVMLVWFAVLALLGLGQLVAEPSVLRAANPAYAVAYFADNGFRAFLSLGAVFLVVTGGEALYADMGHFGRRPIAAGWFTLVLPALLLNYFGQGALLLRAPEAIEHPFFRLAPGWAVLPLVVLTTLATVIASQALISGLFSLTLQAVQLDYAPRVDIDHTSPQTFGQVYIRAVNWGLLAACIGLVVGFRSSANLAAAYGVAVTATMVITTLLFAVVARERFRWPLPAVVALGGIFLVVEAGFLGANLFKIPEGGWFPLAVGAILFTVLTTWRNGREILRRRVRTGRPLETYLDELFADGAGPTRVPGTAVYLFGDVTTTAPALIRNLRHHKVLHERVLIVTVIVADTAHVDPAQRSEISDLGRGFCRVVLRYGFMEEPYVTRGLAEGVAAELGLNPDEATFFIAAEDVQSTPMASGMARWREQLFAVLHRNATPAADWFCLPSDRVVIVGVPVDI